MRKYAVALTCLFLGCAAGSAIPAITAQTYAPNPNAQRWEQFCAVHQLGNYARHLDQVNAAIARLGDLGFEVVSDTELDMGSVRPNSHLVCFKRPAP